MAKEETTKRLGGIKPKGTFVGNLAVLSATTSGVPLYPPLKKDKE